MDHLQEIKSRLSIEELVGSYVPLKKAGRSLKGLCPLHREKTPSFIVSPDKDIAYCFGCNQGGDIFKMTQLLENCDFPEAVKILAEKTGVRLPRTLPKIHNKRLGILEINKEATRFFQDQLNENPKKKAYFLDRGLSEATLKNFQLGFAPDSFTALKEHLLSKGYTEAQMLEAGLIIQRSLADKNTYDRFRNRLIFPILDHQGYGVGFGGRVIDEGEPKYLNSPETPAYNKSFVLYGLDRAKEAIKKTGIAILVEGYMDLIAAHQAGTENVVATSGTALTLEQLKLIKRYTPKVAFAFDRDTAGMEAALRAIDLAQNAELKIFIIPIPHGKDPDECIRKNPKAWHKATEKPISSMDFYFDYARTNFNPETLEGKTQMLAFLLPLIKQYPTEVEQGAYLERLALELKTDIRLLWNDLKKVKKTVSPPEPSGETVASPAKFSREVYLLGLLFQYPHLYSGIGEELLENIFFDEGTKRFYKALKSVYNKERALTLEKVKETLEPGDLPFLDIYRLLIEEYYPDFSEEAAEREIKNLVRSINRANLYRVQKEYEFKIRASSSTEEKNLMLNQYNELLKLTSKL